jgi:hypothetical protein
VSRARRARDWLRATPTIVVSLEVADLTEQELRQEILKLRRRVEKLFLHSLDSVATIRRLVAFYGTRWRSTEPGFPLTDETGTADGLALRRSTTADTRPVGRAVPRNSSGLDIHPQFESDLAEADARLPRPTQPARALVRQGRKSHGTMPAPPYNPHSIAAPQPRGFVQQGLSALSPRRRSTDRSMQCG